jgi:hypothetical protein
MKSGTMRTIVIFDESSNQLCFPKFHVELFAFGAGGAKVSIGAI